MGLLIQGRRLCSIFDPVRLGILVLRNTSSQAVAFDHKVRFQAGDLEEFVHPFHGCGGITAPREGESAEVL